jgi:hypothetical protein
MSQTNLASLATQCLGNDRNIQVVEFVKHLLTLACERGEVQGSFVDHKHLLFESPGQEGLLVELTMARGKLRSICARLGVLCNESSGKEVSLYGGEATFAYDAGPGPVSVSVSFKNTPDEQRFQIRCGMANVSNDSLPASKQVR